MNVGKRIVELREEKGLSTNKLSNLAGVSQSYVREIEMGNKNPTVEILYYICEVLDINLKDFFDYEDEPDAELLIYFNDLRKEVERLDKDKRVALLEFIKKI